MQQRFQHTILKGLVKQALGVVSAALMGLGTQAVAETSSMTLIRPAQFGVIKEVVGARLLVVSARADCPKALVSSQDNLCLDGLKTYQGKLVIGLTAPMSAGQRLSEGQGYRLYDLNQGVLSPRALTTSELQVPRDCFSLKGEGVGYVLVKTPEGLRAEESQVVSCGGGPDRPTGPYRPEGSVIVSDSRGYRVTEDRVVLGEARYLAVPDATCEPKFSIRSTHCAPTAVQYMLDHPDQAELDLIATKVAASEGDLVNAKDIMQWVMKRKTNGFKADGRWFEKSMFTPMNDCYGLESLLWRVSPKAEGQMIRESQLSRCGAPLAPVPTAVYEAYGKDYYILNCGQTRRNHANDNQDCKDQAAAYLSHERRKEANLVILNEAARVGDRLIEGGFISFDFVEAELKDNGDVRFEPVRDSDAYRTNAYRCHRSDDHSRDSQGFIVVRSLGVSWARAFQWVDCPVY